MVQDNKVGSRKRRSSRSSSSSSPPGWRHRSRSSTSLSSKSSGRSFSRRRRSSSRSSTESVKGKKSSSSNENVARYRRRDREPVRSGLGRSSVKSSGVGNYRDNRRGPISRRFRYSSHGRSVSPSKRISSRKETRRRISSSKSSSRASSERRSGRSIKRSVSLQRIQSSSRRKTSPPQKRLGKKESISKKRNSLSRRSSSNNRYVSRGRSISPTKAPLRRESLHKKSNSLSPKRAETKQSVSRRHRSRSFSERTRRIPLRNRHINYDRKSSQPFRRIRDEKGLDLLRSPTIKASQKINIPNSRNKLPFTRQPLTSDRKPLVRIMNMPLKRKFPPRSFLPVDRGRVCPFLLRVFYRTDGIRFETLQHVFGDRDGWSPDREPNAPELQIYGWMDLRLRELTNLCKDVCAETRKRNAKLYFNLLGFDGNKNFVLSEIGVVHSTRHRPEDNTTLKQCNFSIGDYILLSV